MRLSEVKLDSAEWQEGKEGKFRLTQIERLPLNDWHSNWRYSFKYESGEWFQIVLDNVNKLIEIIK